MFSPPYLTNRIVIVTFCQKCLHLIIQKLCNVNDWSKELKCLILLICYSGLCPDWTDWDPNQAKRNATEAMDLAEKWLDVPQVCI